MAELRRVTARAGGDGQFAALHLRLHQHGLQLRILRNNASLRRVAYVDFDLESIIASELNAEFALM